MRGLYILQSDCLSFLNTIKIGMSLELEKRWFDYTVVFSNPYYIYCFVIDEDKKKILSLERIILDKTINEYNNLFTSEYRSLNNLTLDIYVKIIKEILKENNIKYETLYKPTFTKPKEKTNDNIDRTKELEKIIPMKFINEREEIQNDYLQEIIHEIEVNSKCLIKAPTGFGKTNIMFNLINKLSYNVCIIFTPRLLLNRQTEKRGCLLSNEYSYHDFSNFPKKLKIKNKLIIISCYKSEDKLQRFITKHNTFIDLVIFDEVHCIKNKTENDFWFSSKLIKNKIFMSATPYIDQENNEIYGKCIEKIKIFDLINKGILCNFKTIFKKFDNVKDKYISLSDFVLDAMKKYKKKKGILYVNKQENAKKLFKIMKNQNDVSIYLLISKKTEFDGIDTDIEHFEKNDKSSIIITCRKIDYGYDNVFIDLICLGDKRQGQVDIRQICGRGLRNDIIRYPNKFLHILLPIYYNEFEKEYNHVKEYLDFIIAECGTDIIYDEGKKQYKVKSINTTETEYDGEIIPMEVYKAYCSKNGYTGFINYLKSNNIEDEKSYNDLKNKEKNDWMPELGIIRNKYPKFCFRDLIKEKDKYYNTLTECLTKKNEIIKKHKINIIEMLEKNVNKILNSYDSKIPIISFELFYPK